MPPFTWEGAKWHIASRHYGCGASYAGVCLQDVAEPSYLRAWWTRYVLQEATEDCLTLSIWRPTAPSAPPKLPTMVYFHEGGLLSGHGLTDFSKFVMTNRVLVVDVNYRLNVFGFLATVELSATNRGAHTSGNYGASKPSHLAMAVLRGINLRLTVLRGINLRLTVLRGINLRLTVLRGINLRLTVLRGINLRLTVLREVNLRLTVLRGINLRLTVLRLLDAQEALRWVQRNIHHFGGDPDKVTVFGLSSGGTMVFMLLASPQSKGLFHRAMSNSGSPNISVDLAAASKVAECLRVVDANDLMEAMPSCWDPPIMDWPMQRSGLGACGLPVVDGVNLPKPLLEALGQETPYMDVPLIVWNNDQEIGTFFAEHGRHSDILGMTSRVFRDYLVKHFDGLKPDLGEKVAALYSDEIEREPMLAYDQIGSDLGVSCGNIEVAKHAGKSFSSPVYSVVMTAALSGRPGGFLSKAYHGLDLELATQSSDKQALARRDVWTAWYVRDIWQSFAEHGDLRRHRWVEVVQPSDVQDSLCNGTSGGPTLLPTYHVME
eukprot:gene9079-10758_t